jgi:hypothetical protein
MLATMEIPMNVATLIEELSKYDPSFEVILSKDEEGNGFSPLAEPSKSNYIPETTYSGYILNDEDLASEEIGIEEGVMPINCVVLWPTN